MSRGGSDLRQGWSHAVEGNGWSVISRDDVLAASARIRGYVRRTPLLPPTKATETWWLKCEFLQCTGVFKTRGAFNRQLAAQERGELDPSVGVVVASGGDAAWPYQPVRSREVSPADYADALERLHAGMRKLDVPAPHSPIASIRLNSLWRAATALRRSPTRTGNCSATRYEAWDEGSASVAVSSSCCTASRTRATCSPRRTGRCSSTSRRVAVDLSN